MSTVTATAKELEEEEAPTSPALIICKGFLLEWDSVFANSWESHTRVRVGRKIQKPSLPFFSIIGANINSAGG